MIRCWNVDIGLLVFLVLSQSADPAVQWQLNLYKDVVVKSEGPPDAEQNVERVQGISAAVYHLEQVQSA